MDSVRAFWFRFTVAGFKVLVLPPAELFCALLAEKGCQMPALNSFEQRKPGPVAQVQFQWLCHQKRFKAQGLRRKAFLSHMASPSVRYAVIKSLGRRNKWSPIAAKL